jgi:hypothetical protein
MIRDISIPALVLPVVVSGKVGGPGRGELWAKLQSGGVAARISGMQSPQVLRPVSEGTNPFQPGTMVVVTLSNPREKLWGAILALSPEGLSLRGIELASFEDLVALVKDGEPFSLGVVFFPMHRVERMELDLPDGNIPSLSQRFAAKTGLDPANMLTARDATQERA